MSQKYIRSTLSVTKRQLRAGLSFCLVFLSAFLAIGNAENVFAKANSRSQTVVDIPVLGPGALYIAKSDTRIGFWILNDTEVRRVGEVLIIDPTAPERLIKVNLSGGVNAVFYAGDLPLSLNLRMSFEGSLENTGCPDCTLTMPLAPDSWIDSLLKSEEGGQVEDYPGLITLVKQQNEIFNIAQKVKADVMAQESIVTDMMTMDLFEFNNQSQTAANEADARTTTWFKTTSNYEKILGDKIGTDSSIVQETTDAYANYLPTQTAKIDMGGTCANSEQFWLKQLQMEKDLRFKFYPDDGVERDHEDSPPSDREEIIAAAEDDFLGMQDEIEPCITSLLGGIYTTSEDIQVPGAVPDLSQENLISQAAYEKANDDVSQFINNTDIDLQEWQPSVEQRSERLDEIDEYNAVEQNMEKSMAPLLAFLDPELLDENAPETRSDNDRSGKKANSKSPANPNASKSSSTLGQSNCDDDFILTFDLGAVSILLGTKFDDSITAANDKNLILTFRGDDCVQGGDDYDAVFTMAGDDKIYGGGSHNVLFGGKGTDTIYSEKGKSYTIPIGTGGLTFDLGSIISGGAGDDTLIGGAVNDDPLDRWGDMDIILGDGLASAGDAGKDTIDGKKGINFIFGQGKDDTVTSTGYGRIGFSGFPIILGSVFITGSGEDTITGTSTPFLAAFGDIIVGGPDKDIIFAESGPDLVIAGGGNDVVNGGSGNDILFLGDGDDTAHGDDGIELIIGNDGVDRLFSDSGVFAVLAGNGGEDVITGGGGVDLALGNADTDSINTGGGFDINAGGGSRDFLDGGAGPDLILGGDGDDNISTGEGAFNVVFAGAGFDNVTGGNDFDIIFGMSNAPSDQPDQFCDNNAPYEILNGGSGMDIVVGGTGCDRVSGQGGINLLIGGDATDYLVGGPNTDFMWGGRGRDTFLGFDGVDVGFGGKEEDVMNGGPGIDVFSGGSENDFINGDSGSDILIGNAGIDTLSGNSEPNLLIGGDGSDTLNGGTTSSIMFGGDNDDTTNAASGLNIHFSGSGSDIANGGTGTDIMFGGGEIDDLRGKDGNDIIFGGGSNDTLDGGIGNNINFGGDGGDSINNTGGSNVVSFGNSGNDIIQARDGRVVAFGNSDDDNLQGGCTPDPPRDFLFGNGGSDTLRGTKSNSRDILIGGSKSFC